MNHHFILRHLRRPRRHDHHYHHPFTTTTISSINWVRDRALDHAVEKERDLKPTINLKNLIISEPSKSLPLSIISDKKPQLLIPTRPIDFIRKYPSIFQEFLPGGIGIHPHIKLTQETLTLDSEEQMLFSSEIYKQDVANRLLKLLMLGRINRIPISVIDRLKWDLGLPNDYIESVVPQFPDYFQVGGNGSELELVCWNNELAVSIMQSNSMSLNSSLVSFPLQYSRGFEVDKKFKKWVDEWQKLPYVSPYESLLSLEVKDEELDKWVVGLLHEVLSILVPKKTEKDNLLVFGEYLGVRSRFKKALLQHPGIFYVSSKLRTHTVVLREGYKRDLLVGKAVHPLMKLRGRYIHLMNMVKEKSKLKDGDVGEKKQKGVKDFDGEDDELSDEEDNSETEGVGDSNDDGESEDLEEMRRKPIKRTAFEGRKGLVQRCRMRRSDDNGESEDLEEMQRKPIKRTVFEGQEGLVQRSRSHRGNENGESEDLDENQRKPIKRTAFEGRKALVQRSRMRRSNENGENEDLRENQRKPIKRKTFEGRKIRTRRSNDNGESEDLENGNAKIRGRTSSSMKFNDSNRRNTSYLRVNDYDGRRGRGKDRKYAFDEKSDSRTSRMSDRRVAKETNPSRFLKTEAPGTRASHDRSSERSNFSRTKEGRI